MEAKSPLLSRTLWVNFLVAFGAIISTWVPAVADLMSQDNLLIIFSVINMMLRVVTKSAVEFK